MARDEIWDIMKAESKRRFNENREGALKEAHASNDGGWTIHTDYHWSRTLNGHRLDYWPSRRKFRFRGKVMRGDVNAFISKREAAND